MTAFSVIDSYIILWGSTSFSAVNHTQYGHTPDLRYLDEAENTVAAVSRLLYDSRNRAMLMKNWLLRIAVPMCLSQMEEAL